MDMLDHEHIAKLYEVFESKHAVFIIMEYINGDSLHEYLLRQKNRRLGEQEAKVLWRQIVQAVNYCHYINVTHRDIKLENIMLDESEERVKLVDMGFATC